MSAGSGRLPGGTRGTIAGHLRRAVAMTPDCESEAPDRSPQFPDAGIPEAAPRRQAGRPQDWTPPITVALAVGAEPTAVLDELHVFVADSEGVLNEKIGGLQTMAKINSGGIATRKARESEVSSGDGPMAAVS